MEEHALPSTGTDLNQYDLGKIIFFLLEKTNSHSLAQNLGQRLLGKLFFFKTYFTDIISVPIVSFLR